MNIKLQAKFQTLTNLYRRGSVKPEAIALTPAEFDALCDLIAPYTQTEMEDAFKFVQNPTNWKLPIDCVIPEVFKDRVNAAIDHFAGGQAKFEKSIGGLRVTAPGYYAIIGA